MKRYLIRGRYSSMRTPGIEEIIVKDYYGSNAGNMLYADSLFALLMNENVEIDNDDYKGELNGFSNADIDVINEKYDAYILTLADAFRDDFIEKLNNYTNLLKRLRIPVYVIGVGLRAEYDPDLTKEYPFDNAAKAFISQVLEHSAMVGVRGEITLDYLKNWGLHRNEK